MQLKSASCPTAITLRCYSVFISLMFQGKKLFSKLAVEMQLAPVYKMKRGEGRGGEEWVNYG